VHHRLQPGARRPGQADRPVVHLVAEGERDPAEARGAAIGPHHEEPTVTCRALQCDLVLDSESASLSCMSRNESWYVFGLTIE
jgi:hypothetical protein